jgi:hypothetical protein
VGIASENREAGFIDGLSDEGPYRSLGGGVQRGDSEETQEGDGEGLAEWRL